MDGKILVMATPRLRKGFLLLDPCIIPRSHIIEASSIRGAFKHGSFIKPFDVKVDFSVVGSVAVSEDGGRLGKGTGYSDREYWILRNAGSLASETAAATTVHELQIVERIPKDEWDVPVDVIVTPSRVICVK